MRATSRRYASLSVLALVFLVCLAALPTRAAAQAPSITIFGESVAQCPDNGAPVAAGPQGSSFQVDLTNFPVLPGGGGVFVTIATPDGRLINVGNPLEIAGLGIPPLAFPPAFPAPQPALTLIARSPVDSMVTIPTALNWPIGCYAVTVATPDPTNAANPSGVVRSSRVFRLLPATFPTQPANLQLTVQAVGTIEPTGTAPVTVNILGRGPVGGPPPVIHIIRPDGSIFGGVGGIATAPSGSPGGFVGAATFLPPAATGVYTVVASVGPAPITGALARVTGASTRAQFTLADPPTMAQGNAVLSMAPFAAQFAHNPFPPNVAVPVVIQGRRFPAGAVFGVLVLPSGARLLAPPAVITPSGNLNFPALPGGFVLNRTYPAGEYRFEVWTVAANPTLLASIRWRVTP